MNTPKDDPSGAAAHDQPSNTRGESNAPHPAAELGHPRPDEPNQSDAEDTNLAARLREAIEHCPRMLVPGGARAWPDKKLVELGATRDLVAALRAAGAREITDVHPRIETKPQTPPDVLGRCEHGGLIGFEVVELTDQEMIQHNIPLSRDRHAAVQAARDTSERLAAFVTHEEKVRVWNADELLADITWLVKRKDSKAFAVDNEPYSERWLVIHTSEPFLDWQAFIQKAATAPMKPLQQLDEVYIVRDFDPATGTHPWCRVARPRSDI